MHPLIYYQKPPVSLKKAFVDYDGNLHFVQSFYKSVEGYRQQRPYNVDTFYHATTYELVSGTVSATSWGWTSQTSGYPFGDAYKVKEDSANKARKRLVSQLGETSQVGATLTAEYRATRGMLVDIALRAYRSARAVRRLDLYTAANELGIKPPSERTYVRKGVRKDRRGRRRTYYRRERVIKLPTGREVSKNAAGAWLWYSYGVKPLMEDAYNCVDILQRPIPFGRIRATGTSERSSVAWNYWRDFKTSMRLKVRVSLVCEASVSNPNLYLANQMGLTNPLQMANEAIPFSFVADWFSNWSDVISSLTELNGVNISNLVTTVTETSDEQGFDYNPSPKTNGSYSKTREEVTRVVGGQLPSTTLRFGYERFSWQRGANAISLLVGFLPRK